MRNLQFSKKFGMALLQILTQPRAKINQVNGFHNGSLKVRLAATTIQGRANLALLHFLSNIPGLHSGHLCLVRGFQSKYKSIGIKGLTQKQVIERLSRHLKVLYQHDYLHNFEC